jgi:hypothetical protein
MVFGRHVHQVIMVNSPFFPVLPRSFYILGLLASSYIVGAFWSAVIPAKAGIQIDQ